jgi:hypothetical protein
MFSDERYNFDNPDELYSHLRLSNFGVWGIDGRSRWVFRGQACTDWQYLPSAWRHTAQNYLEPWMTTATHIIRKRLSRIKNVGSKYFDFSSIDVDHYVRARAQAVSELQAIQQFSKLRTLNFAADPWRLQNYDFLSDAHFDQPDHDFPQYLAEDITALAQHHGVPTRLLDWSEDPLVALAFCVFDIEQSDVDAELCALDSMSLKVPQDTRGTFTPFVWKFKCNPTHNAFSFSQKSFHTYIQYAEIYYVEHGCWPDHLELGFVQGAAIRKFAIPKDWKRHLARKLWSDGYDPVSLLPNLDGVGKAAAVWARIIRRS